jgi:hypothetical protein
MFFDRRRLTGLSVILAIAGLSACAPALAPPPPLQAPVAAPRAVVAGPPAGRLSGTITDAQSGVAIQGVRVSVGSPSLDAPRQTTTDRAGRYEIALLPVGTFTVSARADTYVDSGFAFRRLDRTQGSIALSDQQHQDNVDIRLTRAGSISGRIFDDEGAPVGGAAVNVLRPHFDEGQRLLATLGTTRTDTDGQFRVAGLGPGDYYVTVFEPDPTVTTAVVATHSPTYYPGSADAAGARRIRVTVAAEVVDINFVVTRVPWTRIRGEAKRADNDPLRFAAIIMQPNDPEGLSAGPQLGARWQPDGSFTFEQVPPGEYIIRALGEIDEDEPLLFASLPLTVEGRHITGIVLTLTRGATLAGRVRFASRGSAAPDVTQLRLYAPLQDGTKFGGEPKGQMGSDGRFSLIGVDAGARLIRALNVPAPWSLQRVTQRGRDITDTPIIIQQGQKLQDVELVFTDSAPTVSGVVRSPSGRAIVDGLVVAFPVDRSLWRATSRHIGSARTDWQGHYAIGPLPPGQYLIVSVSEYDEADLFERETLDQLSRKATSLTLSTSQKRVLDLIDRAPGGLRSLVPF